MEKRIEKTKIMELSINQLIEEIKKDFTTKNLYEIEGKNFFSKQFIEDNSRVFSNFPHYIEELENLQFSIAFYNIEIFGKYEKNNTIDLLHEIISPTDRFIKESNREDPQLENIFSINEIIEDFKKIITPNSSELINAIIEGIKEDCKDIKIDLQDFLLQWIEYKETTSILKLCINTGTVWLKCIYTIGTTQDDILGTIEEYIGNNPRELREYDYNELLDIYDNYEEIEDFHIPINGGEFYIDSLELIEEISYNEYLNILESGEK